MEKIIPCDNQHRALNGLLDKAEKPCVYGVLANGVTFAIPDMVGAAVVADERDALESFSVTPPFGAAIG